jgi:hypothetical protein
MRRRATPQFEFGLPAPPRMAYTFRQKIEDMKNLALTLLFLLGFAEIVVGTFIGRMMIYAHEAPFGQAIELPPERSQAFLRYIRLFQDQWSIVTWFGFLTILFAALLIHDSLRAARLKESRPAEQ